MGSKPIWRAIFFAILDNHRTQNWTSYPASRSEFNLDVYSIREVRLKLRLLDPVAHKMIYKVGHRSCKFIFWRRVCGRSGVRWRRGRPNGLFVDPHSAGGPPPGCPASPRRRARRRAGAWRRWRGCSRRRPGPPIRCSARTRSSQRTCTTQGPSVFLTVMPTVGISSFKLCDC